MKSLLWKTFGLTAPILLGLIGFSSPSEGLVGGGRVVARVCGDVGELTCATDEEGETCLPMSKWANADSDPTDDDDFVVDGRNDCETKNKGTKCKGTGDKPVFDPDCRTATVDW